MARMYSTASLDHFVAGVSQKSLRGYSYFMPEMVNRQFTWQDSRLNALNELAARRLGELDALSMFAPNVEQFIRAHVTLEAVTSSHIEGTHTTLEEAFVGVEATANEQRDDRVEVENYIRALAYASDELGSPDGMPLSNRLLRRAHALLLEGARGHGKQPGEFRRSQNWIGGATLATARFVPPAEEHVEPLMSDLEAFLHNTDVEVPHLLRVGIAHYQFETIHPFNDGNGRLGRLLIILYLMDKGLLSKPLLYLSEFFDDHRADYYHHLSQGREASGLLRWLYFFLDGVAHTAGKAANRLKAIIAQRAVYEESMAGWGRLAPNARTLLHYLYGQPVATQAMVSEALGLAPTTANALFARFKDEGLVVLSKEVMRGRVYVFRPFLTALVA